MSTNDLIWCKRAQKRVPRSEAYWYCCPEEGCSYRTQSDYSFQSHKLYTHIGEQPCPNHWDGITHIFKGRHCSEKRCVVKTAAEYEQHNRKNGIGHGLGNMSQDDGWPYCASQSGITLSIQTGIKHY